MDQVKWGAMRPQIRVTFLSESEMPKPRVLILIRTTTPAHTCMRLLLASCVLMKVPCESIETSSMCVHQHKSFEKPKKRGMHLYHVLRAVTTHERWLSSWRCCKVEITFSTDLCGLFMSLPLQNLSDALTYPSTSSSPNHRKYPS